jgi:Uma2 family endonuclease
MHPGTLVNLPEKTLPARITINPDSQMSDEEYYAFCVANPGARFERTSQGEIVIVPPAGGESSFRSVEVSAQLRNWARLSRTGRVFDSSAEFFLPTGAALSPDAAWVSNARLKTLSKTELRKFPHLTPEFVVEVMSPSDRLKPAREKMQEWMRAGVDLAWLIDGAKKTIYIYRAGQPEEKRTGIQKISGTGPVEGFELDLTEIWAGL